MTNFEFSNGKRTWLCAVALMFLIVVAMGRIVHSYGGVSQTIDEAFHIGTGLEWLDNGTYQLNQENPPFPRAVVALGPYLDGAAEGHSIEDKYHVLVGGSSYLRTLYLSRLGNLPFFVAAALVVWFWAVYTHGYGTALAATALFSTMPMVLGHSGLATTDVAVTATIAGTIFCLGLWLERPSMRRGLYLGIAAGLAVLCKFTAIIFLPVSAIALIGTRWLLVRKKERKDGARERPIFGQMLGSLCIAAGVAALLVWAGYQFSVGPIRGPQDRPYVTIDAAVGTEGRLHDLAYQAIESRIYPAPELLGGLGVLVARGREGKTAYLLGEVSQHGFWYFFPVAFLVKTPIPFLILIVFGSFTILRRTWRDQQWLRMAPLVSSAAIMISVLPSSINIGLRYLLPLYAMLSIVAAVGITSVMSSVAWRSWGVRLGAVGILFWYLIGTMGTHPAYLSYFNELAGANPEEILVDSDLDWGQDVGRLADDLRSHEIRDVKLALFTTADLGHFDWPENTSILEAHEFATGWIAASMFRIKVSKEFSWLEAHEPARTVGSSIRLYYITEAKAK